MYTGNNLEGYLRVWWRNAFSLIFICPAQPALVRPITGAELVLRCFLG